jgi:hypothetical protein
VVLPGRRWSRAHNVRPGTMIERCERRQSFGYPEIQELTVAPEALPFVTLSDRPGFDLPLSAGIAESSNRQSMAERLQPAHLRLSLATADLFRAGMERHLRPQAPNGLLQETEPGIYSPFAIFFFYEE